MSKARELAALGNAFSDGALSNRNMVINGNFSVWQRGASASGLTTGQVFVADRWVSVSSGGNTNISRQEFSNGQTDVPNASYFLRHDITTAPNYVQLDHRVEDLRRFDGQTVTVSFWAKASSNMTLGFEFVSNHGAGGTVEVNGNYAPYNKGSFAVTTSWQKFTATVTTTSLAGKSLGTSHHFITRFIPSSGSEYRSRWGGQSFVGQFDLAQVQLEVGDTATPFEHRSYGQELALCQRYFNINQGGYSTNEGIATAYAGNKLRGFFQHFPVTMRTTPSVAISNPEWYNGSSWVTGASATVPEGNPSGFNADISQSSPFTPKYSYPIQYSFTADAEL